MFQNPVNVVSDIKIWINYNFELLLAADGKSGEQPIQTNRIQNSMTVHPFMNAKQISNRRLPQHHLQLHDPIQNQRWSDLTIMLFNDCRFIALISHYHQLKSVRFAIIPLPQINK